MSKLTDKASYIKGLAAGMTLNMEKDSNKLLAELLELVRLSLRYSHAETVSFRLQST